MAGVRAASGLPKQAGRRRRWIAAVVGPAIVAGGAGYGISAALGGGPGGGGATATATACRVGGLAVSEYGASAAAGTALVVLRIKDAARAACKLSGTPALDGLSFSDGSSRSVAVGSARSPSALSLPRPPTSVLLDRSRDAGVVLSSAEVPVDGASGCARMSAIRLALRGEAGSLVVRLSFPETLCGRGAFGVSPFYPFGEVAPAVRPLSASTP